MKISDTFAKLEGVAPLLCAGITTYSPIRAHQSKVGPGKVIREIFHSFHIFLECWNYRIRRLRSYGS